MAGDLDRAVLEAIDLFEPQFLAVEESQHVPPAGGPDVHRQIRLLSHVSPPLFSQDLVNGANTITTIRYRVS